MRWQPFSRRGFIFIKRSAKTMITALMVTANLIILALIAQTSRTAVCKRQMEMHSKLADRIDIIERGMFRPNFQHLSYFPESKRHETSALGLSGPYVINNENICKSVNKLSFIIIVSSATENGIQRNTIRKTWGNAAFYRNHEIRVVFLLGQSKNSTVNQNILSESRLYNDIVQGSFLDTYANLTYKSVMGMRWLSENCLNTKVVIKADDDVFINVHQLLNDVDTLHAGSKREVHCNKRNVGTSLIQRGSGKWMMPNEYFANFTYYPFVHCNGWFVMMTPDIVQSLYETSKRTPFIWIDDVFLFGLVFDIVGGININDMQTLKTIGTSGLECFKSREKVCDLHAVIVQENAALENIWENALKNRYSSKKK